MAETIYDRLGTKPIINARGIYTDLGGSRMSPRVWAAVQEANASFVEMVDLLDATGRRIAALVGAQAARVTPGASAAIALGIAACMTGQDGAKMEQLPDTTGMANKVLIQRRQRYKYDRMVRMTGATLVAVGDESGTTAAQLSAAIDGDVAAICYPAHLQGTPGTLTLREVTEIARSRGVSTLVDAAYLNFPTERFGSFLVDGADLALFSSKYFGGPNAGGFICGRRDLIDAVAGVDFTRFESGQYLIFGRPFKLDRQTVVAVTVALEEWFEQDHDARFEDWERRVRSIERHLRGLPGVATTPMSFTMEEELIPEPVNCLVVDIDPMSGASAQRVDSALRAGNPGILVHRSDERLIVDVEVIDDAEAELIGRRLREELTRGG